MPPVAVPEITVEELPARLAAGRALVDVRQPEEFHEVHVPGARLIPLDAVGDRLEEIRSLGSVDVICRSGARSHRAADFLIAQGVDATNVVGGTLAWIAAGGALAAGPE